jgi:nitroimidazol reductase NimA-like FMN-containing flavoprotein (pyridoxamine 5'-phosphate oxidase superfamily)
MSEAECLRLLAAGGVGRVALAAPDGPHIMPVNFALHGESIVFRTSPLSVLGTYGWRTRLAFEIDHVDYERWRGWSVVASGPGAVIEDQDELAAVRAHWDPRPWAGGQRLFYIRLTWDRLTGRQIGEGWSASDEPEIRRVELP